MSAARSTLRRMLVPTLWLATSALLLWLTLHRMDLGALRAAWRQVRATPLVAAVILLLLLVVSKGRRLSLLLRGAGYSCVGTRWLTAMYLASYTLDNLLFSQAGVGSRVLLLRGAGVPLSLALGSQALDKLLEGAGLLCLLPLMPTLPMLPWLRLGYLTEHAPLLRWPWMVGGGLLLVAFLIVLISARHLLGLSIWLTRRAQGTRPLLEGARRAAAALNPLRAPWLALEIGGLTMLGWLLELSTVWLVALACGVAADPRLGLVTVAFVSMAMLIPGLPANLGPFEAAAARGFQGMGLGPEQALLAALIYHAAHTVPVTLAGIPLLRWIQRRMESAQRPTAER